MDNRSSITSLMASFGRIYHAENERQPIFDDRLAKQLLTDEEYRTIGSYILGGMDFFAPEKKGTFSDDDEALLYLVNTQIAPTPLARAAYCDEMIKTAVRTGTRQVVLLGAGIDTFAFRNTDMPCRIFEVDHPLTQQDKLRRIQNAGWDIPQNLTFVSADLGDSGFKGQLIAAGFDPNVKTFFSWLGVSYYMTIAQIDSMLKVVSELSADGSALLFDYGDENMFTSQVKRVQNMIAMAAAGGEPMKFSFSEMELAGLLEDHGFLMYELMTSADIDRRYFLGRDYRAFEHINYCLSVFKKEKQ